MLVVWVLACGRPEPATVREASVRVVLDAEVVRLEVPVRRLHRDGGPEVVLAGAVHVADPAFYADLAEALAGCAVVLREGLEADPDAPAPDDALGPLLAARGLTRQGDALRGGPGWRTVDGSVAAVRAALGAGGAGEAEATSLLDDRSQGALHALLAGLPDDPHGTALARFTLLRGIAAPSPRSGEAADRYWEIVVGDRDERVVEAVGGPGPVGVLYGADHLADLEARLTRRGWQRTDEQWLSAVDVPLADLGLGATQVRQLLVSAAL